MRTIVVTGGSGFIGSNLCNKLIENNNKVICIDNLDAYYSPAIKRKNIKNLLKKPNFVFFKTDIRNSLKTKKIFKKYKPTHVVHLAALAGVRASIENAGKYADVNLIGTISVLDAAREVGVKNFILGSTSSVYGATKRIPFKEEAITDMPLAPYPASKKAAEVMAYSYHNLFDLNISCLRFFTVYGPHVRPDMMAYTIMDDIVKDKQITLFDNAKLRRDWTYVDDVCEGIISSINKPLKFEIINIGRGEPIMLTDFVNKIERLSGKKAKIKLVKTPLTEPTETFADISKAKRLLGFNPTTTIDKGLEKTWEWYIDKNSKHRASNNK